MKSSALPMNIPPIDGIVAVPATPFTDDNRLDLASLRRYAEAMLARGAAGFLAPAVAGEVAQLSQEERETIVSTLLEVAAGRVAVIGGATDPDPAARLRHARRFIEMGCTGVLAYIEYTDDASYARAIRDLGNLNPGFLMIQDLDLGSAPLPVPLIAKLHREVPCFKWIKVETGDRCAKASAISKASGPTLRIGSAGPDLIELLDRGIHAYLPTFGIGVYDRIWRAHRSGRRDEAVSLYRRFVPVLSFMATHQKIQWRFTKSLLNAEGLFATTRIRIPAPDLDPIEQHLVDDLCRYLIELQSSG